MTIGIFVAYRWQTVSLYSFDTPYTEIGALGESSRRGEPSRLGPAAVRLLTNVNFFRRESERTASRRFFVASTFPSW